MKTQILIIGGGRPFEKHEDYLNYILTRDMSLDHFRNDMNWRNNLQAVLGDAFDVLIPQMPNNWNARYSEWKIWFERILPVLDQSNGLILVGHSLGGIFLMKYLSENICLVKIRATFLLAAPFVAKGEYPLADFFINPRLPWVEEQAGKIFIFHDVDDTITPVVCADRYKAALPNANLQKLKGFGHLNSSGFPQLVAAIRSA